MSMHIRKNVKNLTSDEKTKFVNAILILKTTNPSVLHQGDPTKNRYDDYVEIHMMAMMAGSQDNPRDNPNWQPGWAHNGPAFFSWHRVLLLQFEAGNGVIQRYALGKAGATVECYNHRQRITLHKKQAATRAAQEILFIG